MHIMRTIRFLLLAAMIFSVSAAMSAQVLISVSFGPPALPIYAQPICPGEDYIWVPGYWAWSPIGYYWVPGTWVLAPEPGLLWTPGYWAFDDGLFYWHPGYWAPVVGYYGGIVYGFGYTGSGYYGGYWRNDHFYYNQTVTNVNVTSIRYVYRQPVASSTTTMTRISYNGGPGGTTVRPTAQQAAATGQRRVAPTSAQITHEQAASKDRELLATENQGRPLIAATAKPADLKGRGVVPASAAGAPYRAPENRAAPRNPASPPPVSTPAARPPKTRPENRPQNHAVRPEVEPPRTPSRPEAPPPPNERRPEAAPQPREARPENAPHPQNNPPAERNGHSDKKAPPHSGGEEHRR